MPSTASAPTPVRLTAAQVIILAADDLMTAGAAEFTEWDLSVAAWTRDRVRFGLRGYDQKHPDHKRVMMEIMGAKPQNPLSQRFMEKVRPNFYKLTPLGRAEAARLRSGGSAGREESSSPRDSIYRTAAALAAHATFRHWQQDPDQPRRWADAAVFLTSVQKAKDPPAGLDAARRAVRAAIDWCLSHDVVYLTPAGRGGGEPIHIRTLSEVSDFLRVLEFRFEEHLAGATAGRGR